MISWKMRNLVWLVKVVNARKKKKKRKEKTLLKKKKKSAGSQEGASSHHGAAAQLCSLPGGRGWGLPAHGSPRWLHSSSLIG